MVHVAELVAYPVKSLDGCERERIRLTGDGPLVGDRVYAPVEGAVDPADASVGANGGYVNGKSERQIHRIDASYETASPADATPTAVTLDAPGMDTRTFDLPAEADAAGDWLSAFVGYDVDLAREDGPHQDRSGRFGPSVISEATLEEVASWFEDPAVDAREMRRRFRPNVVLAGCPAFWEDRLFAGHDERVRVRVGDGELTGVGPCARCVVPSRDPETGAELPNFRETFLKRRRETMPEWSGGERFDHDFQLMTTTAVPESAWGAEVAVGDEVEILETVAVEA
ncbi:MOSC domain-containing protein [Haloparvum sp. AD34]